ncbi:MAG: nicotinamide mononucleotide transporter [Chloroflexi bacterium]|nr:nicotinamide mononucleotide transporter [Chloroflexota bacterium]
MGLLEIAAVSFGLICVWQTVKENVWCWVTGSISNILFSVAFFQSKLYSDVGLQIVYILLNAYGWYEWKYGGKNKTELPISTTAPRWWAIFALISIASIALMGTALHNLTDTDVAYWDATTTVLSLVAQFMLTKKLIENWWIWITVNMLYIGIYFYKGLYLTSAQQIVYIVLSMMGYLAWRKTLRTYATVS